MTFTYDPVKQDFEMSIVMQDIHNNVYFNTYISVYKKQYNLLLGIQNDLFQL